MFVLYLLLLVGTVHGSHYRGGSMSYTIRSIASNATNRSGIPVRVTQRHSWRRSYYFCNNTNPNSGDLIGEDFLRSHGQNRSTSLTAPSVNAHVRCTDFNEEFDYSSGEMSTTVLLPLNDQITYRYNSCCWIPLLPPDSSSDWSLQLIISTKRRADGSLNNSPKTTMNPIVQLQRGKMHVIHIPMADSDGDPLRCRWGQTPEECGSICSPKGFLQANPCQITYNASDIGYQAVAIIIEDFDALDNVLSSVPLQFLIHIVNTTDHEDNATICTEPPVYVGDWPEDSCIGVESNTTVSTHIRIRIPCTNTSTVLDDILTVSPAGLTRGPIVRDPFDPNTYTMSIEWTPRPEQDGIEQLCVTPVDSHGQTGSQVCLTFQVNMRPPQLTRLSPAGVVSATHASWTIQTDRDIIRPKRSRAAYIRFFEQSTHDEVYRIDVTTATNVVYQSRQITFYTTGYTWKQNETYYILLDSGIATINASCGIESVSITDRQVWMFHISAAQTSISEQIFTEPSVTSTRRSAPTPRAPCPRWLPFGTISNETTQVHDPSITFCFSVQLPSTDVTISANTWVPCMLWKLSGAADPQLELYSEPNGELLAQNDDGNGLPLTNCYAAVLSYRLHKGDYRVIVRHSKCAFGRFELRLSAETDRLTT